MGRKRTDHSSSSGFGATLGDALRAQGLAPTGAAGPSEETAVSEVGDAAPRGDNIGEPSTTNPSSWLVGCSKVVVRIERKGRRGKAVTFVQPIPPVGAAAGEELARLLRRALGCGAIVEDDGIVVQGDQRDRLPALLESHGARRVVRG